MVAIREGVGTGRRKSAVARCRVRAGSGKVIINKRELAEYFPVEKHRTAATAPLTATATADSVDVYINVAGGGITGQADACKMGIARALKEFNGEHEAVLRQQSLLTRDSREVERKKYGRAGARKSFQFSKR